MHVCWWTMIINRNKHMVKFWQVGLHIIIHLPLTKHSEFIKADNQGNRQPSYNKLKSQGWLALEVPYTESFIQRTELCTFWTPVSLLFPMISKLIWPYPQTFLEILLVTSNIVTDVILMYGVPS